VNKINGNKQTTTQTLQLFVGGIFTSTERLATRSTHRAATLMTTNGKDTKSCIKMDVKV
jgi:uncharacterized protein YfaQ (DUF2300 family)